MTTTMTPMMRMATLAALAGLGACASGKGMSGNYGGSAGAGGAAGVTNAPADSAAVPPSTRAKDTAASQNTPTTSANMPASGKAAFTFGSDAHIVSAIDVANTDEIAAGMLARDRAQSAGVRAFANRMVTDHTQMQAKDRAFAARPEFAASDSADVTRAMRGQDTDALAQLRGAPSGAPFDVMYLNQQVDAHKKVLALLKAARDQARDTQLRDAIDGAIPQVQAHLDQAVSLQRSLGTTATPSPGR